MEIKDKVKQYLPRHKLDNFYMDELNSLNDDELKPVLVDLLGWIKNMNFPISVEISQLLSKRPNLVYETFIDHLNDPKIESVYKYNIIAHVIENFDKEEIKKYQKELNRIATNPTKEEKYAEVNVIASKLL